MSDKASPSCSARRVRAISMKRRYAILDTTPPQSVSKNITCTSVRIEAAMTIYISNCRLGFTFLFRTLFGSGRNSMMSLASQHVFSVRTQLLLVAGLIFLPHVDSIAAPQRPLKFAGVAFFPRSTVTANVPVNAQEKTMASQGGNTDAPYVVGVP